MLRNYFKVIEDFRSPCDGEVSTEPQVNEWLSVEKGDIIVDVKQLDDEWVLGKSIVSQKLGKLPKRCLEELQDDGNEADEKQADCDKEEKLSKRYSNVSAIVSRLSSVKDDSQSPKENETVITQSKAKTARPPRAPPRVRKSREMTNQSDSFRSRASDEGYNSSSHYSGEKPASNDTGGDHSRYSNVITGDVPLLSSFHESPNRLSSPRPSIQDEEGYEIPIFTPRLSVNGEIATQDEKGVKLKFIYQRKSSTFESTENPSSAPKSKILLNSIGENTEDIYETWSTDPKDGKSSDTKRKRRQEKILIGVFIAVSLIISLGFFFLLLFVARFSPLLCFTIGVNIFALIFVALLTMKKQRWLCIAALLAPSLFSRKVKVAICIILCILIIVGPICNISNNIGVVASCRQQVSRNAGNTSGSSETYSMDYQSRRKTLNSRTTATSKTLLPSGSSQNEGSNKTVRIVKNVSRVTQKCKNDFEGIKNRCFLGPKNLKETCVKAINIAVKRDLHSSCTHEDSMCLGLVIESRIDKFFDNINNTAKEARIRESARRIKVEEMSSISEFRKVILHLLPLLLLILLQEAYWYNREYLSNKETDNVYITGKLKALDCDRKERGMRNKLFPLRKLEFRRYVLPSSFLQTSQETKEIKRWLVIWFILGFGVLLITLLDKHVYETLLFVFRDTQDSGPCELGLTKMDSHVIYAIGIVLALLLLFVLVQSYVLRSRSRICSYFYPKRESIRGVYLYYKILHDRSHYWKACRERGKMLSEARRTRWMIGIGHRLFRCLPSYVCNALEKLFVYRCMICNSLTYRKSFVCKDEECFATFCYECHIDMGQTCISCRPSSVRDSVFTSI